MTTWFELPFCRRVCQVLNPSGSQKNSASLSLQSSLMVAGVGFAGWLLKPLNHRGFWRVCRFLGQWFARSGEMITVQLSDDSVMTIRLDDPYWSQLLSVAYHYEPDFEAVLKRLPADYTFIDGGANFGYWSILLSSGAFQHRPVLAIEAFEPTYQRLQTNIKNNHHRFHAVHRALSHESGHRVPIGHGGEHAGAKIDLDGKASDADTLHADTIHQALVLTSTLDDAIENAFDQFPTKLVVKLDVEGQEINALKGCPKLLKQDVLFYYEDHGHDPHSEVTRFILEELGLKVFYVEGQLVTPIGSAEDTTPIKTRQTLGYNFFACKRDSSFLPVFEVETLTTTLTLKASVV